MSFLRRRPPPSTRIAPHPAATGAGVAGVAGVAGGGAQRALPALVVLAAAVFAAVTTEMLPVGVLPQIAASLGVSESRAGLLVSAYAAVVITTSIPLAALVARWPRRPVLVALLSLYAGGNLLLSVAPDYRLALLARLLAGLAHAGFYAVVVIAAVELVPPARATGAIVFINAGNALALTLGVPAGTALATAVGWRWSFAATGVLMVVLAFGIALLVPRSSAPAGRSAEPVLAAVRQRPLLLIALVVLLVTLGHYTALTYISPLLLHAGVGPRAISAALLVYGLAGLLGLLASGTIIRRRPRAGMRAGIAGIAASLLALGLVGIGGAPPAASVAAVAVWGLAFGTLGTALQTAAVRAAPNAGDAAPAMTNTSWNFGIAGGALIGSRELLVASPPVLAVTAAALVVVALVVCTAAGLPVAQPAEPRP